MIRTRVENEATSNCLAGFALSFVQISGQDLARLAHIVQFLADVFSSDIPVLNYIYDSEIQKKKQNR